MKRIKYLVSIMVVTMCLMMTLTGCSKAISKVISEVIGQEETEIAKDESSEDSSKEVDISSSEAISKETIVSTNNMTDDRTEVVVWSDVYGLIDVLSDGDVFHYELDNFEKFFLFLPKTVSDLRCDTNDTAHVYTYDIYGKSCEFDMIPLKDDSIVTFEVVYSDGTEDKMTLHFISDSTYIKESYDESFADTIRSAFVTAMLDPSILNEDDFSFPESGDIVDAVNSGGPSFRAGVEETLGMQVEECVNRLYSENVTGIEIVIESPTRVKVLVSGTSIVAE